LFGFDPPKTGTDVKMRARRLKSNNKDGRTFYGAEVIYYLD